MSNKLNQLLENAKHENPLLTENDVISVINNRSLLDKKQTFLTLKNILIMSVISSIIIGLWMVFYPTATTNLAEQTQPNSPKNKEQITEKPKLNNLFTNADNNKKTTANNTTEKSVQVVDSPKKLPAINNKPTTKLFDPIPFNPLFNENPIDDNRTYFDKDGYLILTNEELAKLGIITDGNVLKYENVTDSIEQCGFGEIIFKTYPTVELEANKKGEITLNNGLFSSKKAEDENFIKNSNKFWPAVIEIINKSDTNLNVTESIWSQGFDKDFFNEVKNNLIPVLVSVKSYKGVINFVFWFKLEPLFYNALSEKIGAIVNGNFKKVSHSEYVKTVVRYREKSTKDEFTKGFDNKMIDEIKRNIIKPNDEQLKALNITKTSKYFKLKTHINLDNKTKKIIVNNIYKNPKIRNKLFFSKGSSTIIPVAKSNFDFLQIIYLKLYSDSIPSPKKKELQIEYLKNNIKRLVPIQVNEHVIWFEPTEELKRIIRIEKEIENKKIDLTKVKLLEFNEKELLNLGIKNEKNEITLPIMSYGNQGSFNTYKKNETISNIISDSVLSAKFRHIVINNQLKPKYPVPYLVTDETGMNWRTYKFDTEKDDKNDLIYYQTVLNKIKNFIPIKITSGNVSIIAWYEPDSLFLSLLPNTESTEIKTEYQAIANNLPAPSCKYFEVCQNVTGKINSYLAYPNPAEQTLNIEIDLAEERQLEFIITDITGKIIKTLNQNLKQAKGTQTYTYQIGELTEGMYLLIITTDKGEKVSTRIVKK